MFHLLSKKLDSDVGSGTGKVIRVPLYNLVYHDAVTVSYGARVGRSLLQGLLSDEVGKFQADFTHWKSGNSKMQIEKCKLKIGGGLSSALLVLIAVLLVVGVIIGRTGASTGEQVAASGPQREESPAERDARMKWWREARFGMFVHWGLYAVPAGEYKGQRSTHIGEWIMEWANIPRADYEKFAPQFNPVKFNAAELVHTAKDAGMRYIVITSKHHDGFAMFDSRASKYNIAYATPYGMDPMRKLAVEATRQGLKFCFYYSIMDWHHPSQYVDAPGKDPTAGNGMTKMRPGAKDEYVKYMKEQLRELIVEYNPAVLWFDGEWVDWWTEADGTDLYNYVRNLKPDIIINNRVGKGRKGMEGLNKSDQKYVGDFGTPEQQIPPTGLAGIDWESCMTMNDTWGYKSYDDNWKSTETIIRNLIDIASKGGNYLLNVGPTAEGLIPQPSVERLAGVGKWMKVNGDAIYGTSAGPFPKQLAFGRATSKAGRIYLHVFQWPSGGKLAVPSWGSVVKKAYLLASPNTALKFDQSSESIIIDVPSKAPDPIASVIVVE